LPEKIYNCIQFPPWKKDDIGENVVLDGGYNVR